jgi:hypothetical protein
VSSHLDRYLSMKENNRNFMDRHPINSEFLRSFRRGDGTIITDIYYFRVVYHNIKTLQVKDRTLTPHMHRLRDELERRNAL